MLNNIELLEKMKLHFPRWMDIRKRTHKSTGGRLLETLAEGTADIQNAIDEFKNDFFLDRLEGKEEDIVDFVYKAHVGNINNQNFTLISPMFLISTDIKEFYNVSKNNNIAYYEDGYLYFLPKHIKNIDRINFNINSYKTYAKLEKVHVWNVYDEFACFLGIERHEDETNIDLEKRILNAYCNRNDNTLINSSEEGLKNVILTELMILDPSLTKQEIKVEKATPDNLKEYYDNFNTILDKLMSINKDVIRLKKWDVDKWAYPHVKVDYIPHVWNYAINAYQNGIGDSEDLKIETVKDIDTVNATITVYEKSKEKVISYIKNKNVDHDFKLELKKYNNKLNSIDTSYKITASEIKDISPVYLDSDITIDYSNKTFDSKELFIENILANDLNALNGIEKKDNTNMIKDKFYRLAFSPSNGDNIYHVKNVNLFYKDKTDKVVETIDLFKDLNDSNFTKSNDGVITFTNAKMFIKSTTNFNSSSNMKDCQEGISIDTFNANIKKGSLSLALENMNLQPLNIDYSCDKVDLPESITEYDNSVPVTKQVLKLNNVIFSDGKFMRDPSVKRIDADFSISISNLKANQLSFFLESGVCIINNNNTIVNRQRIVNSNNTTINLFQKEKLNAEPISIEIKFDENTVIRNFLYNAYNLNIKMNGSQSSNTITIPNSSSKLDIDMECITSKPPIIHSLYVGSSLKNVKLLSSVINDKPDLFRVVRFDTNCNVELQEVDKDGNLLKVIDTNYYPFYQFIAKQPNAYIKVDLGISSFREIKKIDTTVGVIEKDKTTINPIYFIKLNQDDIISKINVEGNKIESAGKISLFDIKFLSDKTEGYIPIHNQGSSERVLCSKLFQSIIVEKPFIENNITSKKHYLVRITKDMIRKGYNIENIKITGLPNDIGCAFVTKTTASSFIDNDDSVVLANEYSGNFEYLFLYPKYAKEYIAYNKYKLVKQEDGNIEILDTFNPLLPDQNLNLCYKIDSLNEMVKAAFDEDKKTVYDLKTWSIGRKPIRLYIDKEKLDVFNKNNYQSSFITVHNNANINSNIIDVEKMQTLPSGEVIDLSKYVISATDDYEAVYTVANNTNGSKGITEYIVLDTTGYSKLNYCNIVDNYTESSVLPNVKLGEKVLVNKTMNPQKYDYDIIYDAGIMVWNLDSDIIKEAINNKQTLNINYSYKYVSGLKLSLDKLYSIINNDTEAYVAVDTINIFDKKDGDEVDLNYHFKTDYLSSKLDIKLWNYSPNKIQQPNLLFSVVLKNSILVFNKVIKKNSILIRSGYYYLNGDEHYLFTNENSENVNKFKNAELYNVTREDGYLELNKTSVNHVLNSSMAFGKLLTTTHSDDLSNDNFGVSSMNSYTACASYNNWNVFGATISLVQKNPSKYSPYNGTGLLLEKTFEENGYAYIEITKALYEKTHISMYSVGEGTIHIGKEIKFKDLRFNKSTNIEIVKDFSKSEEENMLNCTISKESNTKYYIVINIKSSVLIDDIIVQNEDKNVASTGLHVKNIDLLKLSIQEEDPENIFKRIDLEDRNGAVYEGLQFNSKGQLVNASTIDWGITKIKSFNSHQDWKSCILQNVDEVQGVIKTDNKQSYNFGVIETAPINIGDKKMIKNFIYKINDVLLEPMQGFEVKVLTNKDINGNYRAVYSSTNNMFHIKGSDLDKYVKLVIKMPNSKMISSIDMFLEYKTDKTVAPVEKTTVSGTYYTKILDTYETKNYMLKGIAIEEISNIKDVSIKIKAARLGDDDKNWTMWKELDLKEKDTKVILNSELLFESYRYFQVCVTLKAKDAYVKLKHLDFEVI